MKVKLLSVFIILIFGACGEKTAITPKVNDNKFYIDNKGETIAPEVKVKFADWVKVGVECWGIVVLDLHADDKVGRPVKCKVIRQKKNGYECIALEDTRFYKQMGCDKLGIIKGDIWVEEAGDLFLTKETALDTLKQRSWYSDF